MISYNEQTLFNYIKEILIDLIPTTQYDYKDCYSKKWNITIELKCRRTHYPTLLLEKDKYDKLIQHKNPRYVCSTPKGIFSWNLKNINPIWEWNDLPKQTDFQNNELIPKQVCYLDINNSINLTNIYNNKKI